METVVGWRDLFLRLQATGGTATVRGCPAGLGLPELEWVATTSGLNRYTNGVNTATWYPDPDEQLHLIGESR